MLINGVNLLNKNILQKSEKTSALDDTNKQVVSTKSELCSAQAVKALRAMSFGSVNKNYTFLQNINIPELNLNGNMYLLKNGQKCFIAKKSGPMIINTYFNVGSMNEPKNLRGISHYIEHNLFNGSENLKPTEFVEKVNKMGANFNANTGFNSTNYYIQSPIHKNSDLEKIINLHSQMVTKPLFTQDMLDKEKGPVVSEIQMYTDNPYLSAVNASYKNLFGMNINDPDLVGGSVENINALTREDVVNYYNAYYSPQNAITVVIGDVDEKQTIELLSQNFSDFVRKEQPIKYHEKLNPIQQTVRTDLSSKNAQSAIIYMSFVGPKSHEDKLPVEVLMQALVGSKNATLNELLKQYNTDISGSIEQIGNAENSPTVISFASNTSGNPDDILKVLFAKIHEMSYKPISNEELSRIKNKMKYQRKYVSESNIHLSKLLGDCYIQEKKFDSLANFEKNIEKITPIDIMAAARKFLDLNKTSICVVHPENKFGVSFSGAKRIELDIKSYKTPNNVEINAFNAPSADIYSLNFELKSDIPSKKAAIHEILNKMFTKGTSLMSEKEFFDIEDANNISSEPFVSRNSMGISYSFPKASLARVLDNFEKNLFSPALTKENFEKAKEEIKNDYLKAPKRAVDRAIETLYEGTEKEFSFRKIYEELNDVSFDELKEYYDKVIQNSSLRISLTGPLNDNNVLSDLYNKISQNGRVFKSIGEPKELVLKDLKNTVVTEVQERNQADIVQAFRVKETGNIKDKAVISLLNEILGGYFTSRLFSDLREKQKLAYAVRSNLLIDGLNNTLVMKISTTTDDPKNPKQHENLQKAIDGFKFHINKMITEDVSQEELEAAKLQLKSSILFGFELTNSKNKILMNSMDSLYKTQYINSLLDAIENATPADIRAVAKYYLSQPSVISIVASKSTIDKNKDYLKALGEYKAF